MSKLPDLIATLFDQADIRINGGRPWDMQCHDEAAYVRICDDVSLGLGESYMEGMWDCEALDQFFDRALTAHHDRKIRPTPAMLVEVAKARLLNRQNKQRSHQGGQGPLRHRQCLLRGDARPLHAVHLRLLERDRRGPCRRPGGQARPHLPQTCPRARREGPRTRVRVGRFRALCGGTLRRSR